MPSNNIHFATVIHCVSRNRSGECGITLSAVLDRIVPADSTSAGSHWSPRILIRFPTSPRLHSLVLRHRVQYPPVVNDRPIRPHVKLRCGKRFISVNFSRNTMKFAEFSHQKLGYPLIFFHIFAIMSLVGKVWWTIHLRTQILKYFCTKF